MTFSHPGARPGSGAGSFIAARLRSITSGWANRRRLNQDRLIDGFSVWITLSSYLIAVAVFLVAPILALTWAAQPFPGFVIEQTGVVAGIGGTGWSGRRAGLDYPERVAAIDGDPIGTPADFREAMAERELGEPFQVSVITPDGTTRQYPDVRLHVFSSRDLLRLFWLPYGVGLAFLLLGGWVFILRGDTRPARAFAFFCVSAAITTALQFDLVTTHVLSATWTIAIAQTGGALFSLAMLFPEEWEPVKRQPWARFIPYLVSIVLAAWGIAELYDLAHPWDYVVPWRYSYIYIALGILTFLVTMLFRLRTLRSPVPRQQASIILWGSLLSFTPLVVWVIAPLIGIPIPWNAGVFLPFLMLFPVSIGFAILRYRLWDIEVIVNRTLVYSILTVLLGLIYIASVLLLEQLFSPFTRRNQLAAVLSTLAIVALFNPLRARVQEFIDIRFYRRKYDMAQTLAAFSETLRDEVDLTNLVGRLEEVIWKTMQPAHIFTWLETPAGYSVLLHGEPYPSRDSLRVTVPHQDPLVATLRFSSGVVELEREDIESTALNRLMAAGVRLVLPLINQNELMGWLSLGPRLSQRDYSADDRMLLANLAAQAAPSVRVAQLVEKERNQARERERLEHEMHLARVIQLSLLPHEVPALPGWVVAAHYQPAREVGGDFYDFIELQDRRLGLVIGDVTGKGVPAALVMATTRSILRSMAIQLLPPGKVLQLANDQLEKDIPDKMFVTCQYAILEPASGRVCYANAGHNLPYWCRKDGVEELRAHGMPLGIMPGMDYEEKEIHLDQGDCLLLYSDGLIEAHDPERRMFGSQKLRQLLASSKAFGRPFIDRSLSELYEFTGEAWEQEDDITMVVLQRSV